MSELMFVFLVVFFSFLAGAIGSLIGIGGGVIVTAALVLIFKIDIHYALGAALVSVIATSAGATAAFLRSGMANIHVGFFFCTGTTLGAILGATISARLNQAALSVIFGLFVLVIVSLSLRRKERPAAQNLPSDPLAIRLELAETMQTPAGPVSYPVKGVVPGFLLMMAAGAVSGLLAIGSGSFKVLAMDQIMKIPFKVSTATSNFMIGITAAASAGVYLKNGYLDPELSSLVALGTLAGAMCGAKLLPIVPVQILRAMFFVVISLAALQMILHGFGIGR